MSIYNSFEFVHRGFIAKGKNPVFKVQHVLNRKLYALKKSQTNDFQKHKQNIQELLFLRTCNHPNIIKVYGFNLNTISQHFVKEYHTSIIMDYIEAPLSQLIVEKQKKGEYFTNQEVAEILMQLIHAFNYLQQKKVAHRDIKPENILMKANNQPILIDFGEIYFESELGENQIKVKGTPYYMSPELRRIYQDKVEGKMEDKSYDPWKSDVYTLGMVMESIMILSLDGVHQTDDPENINRKQQYYKEINELIQVMKLENHVDRPDFISLLQQREFKDFRKRFNFDEEGKKAIQIRNIQEEIQYIQDYYLQGRKVEEINEKIPRDNEEEKQVYKKHFRNEKIHQLVVKFFKNMKENPNKKQNEQNLLNIISQIQTLRLKLQKRKNDINEAKILNQNFQNDYQIKYLFPVFST